MIKCFERLSLQRLTRSEGDGHAYDFDMALVLIHGAPTKWKLQPLLRSTGYSLFVLLYENVVPHFDKQLTKVIALHQSRSDVQKGSRCIEMKLSLPLYA